MTVVVALGYTLSAVVVISFLMIEHRSFYCRLERVKLYCRLNSFSPLGREVPVVT